MLFLGQQLALGLVAAVLGVVLAVLATPLILNAFGELLYAGVSPDNEPIRKAAVVAVIGAMIVIFTPLPAWRSGRVRTVEASSRRFQRGSSDLLKLAELAMRLRMPHVVVFGTKDVFARKARAWLAIAAMAVVAAVAMMTITVFGMLDRLVIDPTSVGAWPSELRMERLAGRGAARKTHCGDFRKGGAQDRIGAHPRRRRCGSGATLALADERETSAGGK